MTNVAITTRISGATAPSLPGSDVLRELLIQRHSCRGFLSNPVERGTIVAILEMAQRTPSWCNAQPWQITILSGAAAQRFGEAYVEVVKTQPAGPDFLFPTAYIGKYQERRRDCGWRLYEAVGIAKGDRDASTEYSLENYRFFGAPHVAIISSDKNLGIYGAVDCGGYVANFVLSAQSLGVASIPQAALATHPNFVRSHLGLSSDRIVVCGIAFGHEDPANPANNLRVARAPLDDVVSWIV
jgi:nitroreductase